MINTFINRYWLIGLLTLTCLVSANAQTTLSIYPGDPAASPDEAFDGNVLRAGSQFGDAPFYVKFGGSGTRYFEIDSPGENMTKKVSTDGFVFIRPIGDMVIDQSKIKNFSGTVIGSVAVKVNPLVITTIATNVAEALPGTEITVSYRTGAGTFPVDLTASGFKVQLLSADGLTVVSDLLNLTDLYSGREKKGSSFGGTRSIVATIPGNTPVGTYRVRVITQGLIENVLGSASNTFVIKSNTPVVPTIAATNLPGSPCAGSVVSFSFTTTGTFPSNNTFKVQLVNADGSLIQELPGTSTTSPVNATLPASLAAGTYRFRIAATATSVQSNTGTMTVAALPSLTISGNATTTAGATAPVQLSFTGTPPWSFTYVDNNTVRSATSSANQTTITPTFSTATTYDRSFILGFRDSGCGTSDNINGSAQISIRQNQIILTTGTLSGTFCPGVSIQVPFSASGSLPATTVYQVQLSDAAGSFVNAPVIGSGSASPVSATLPASLAAGLGYRVQVVVQKPTAGGIDHSTSTTPVPTAIAINRPTAPLVADVSFCSTTVTAPLSATGTGLKWYNANNVPISGPPTPPANQPSTYYVTQTINSCESLSARINVTPTAAPAAPMVSNVSLCQGEQKQLTSPTPNSLWYTTATGGTGSTQPPAINGQVVGEQTVYVTQTVNGCESPRAIVKASVYAIPAAPTVPAPTTLCQNTTAGALTADGSLLTWYTQSGDEQSVPPAPNTSVAGTQSYSVSQTVNGCRSRLSVISVIILPAPAPPTANSARFCENQTPVSLIASGTNLRWYTEPTGGTSTTSSPPFSTQTATTQTFYVTQTDANRCESLRQSVSVSVIAKPPAPTVTDIVFCQGGRGQFSSSIPNALWYTAATGGTGSSQPPVVNGQTVGDQTFYVSQTLNGCEGPRAAVKATVYPIPPAPTPNTPNPVCQFAAASPLSANGGELIWYDQSGKLPNAPIPNTTVSGVKSYSVSQWVNGCESTKIVVQQVVRPAPANPSVDSIRYCVGDTPRSLTAGGSSIRWYSTLTGGTGSSNAPTFVTSEAKSFTFYATQTDNNGCESQRQPVTVLVVPAPSAPLVMANQEVCQFSPVRRLTVLSGSGLVWQGTGIIGTSEIAPSPVTTQPATFTYSVVQKAGGCVSPASMITFIVRKLPDAPLVASPVILCIGQTSQPLSATATGQLKWYTNADRTGASFPQITPITSQTSVTTYYVTQTDVYKCESPNSLVEVRLREKATARLTGDGEINLGDSTAIRVRLTGEGPWQFTDWNGRRINANDSLYVIWVKPRQPGQVTYAIQGLTGSCGAGDIRNSYSLLVRAPLSVQPVPEPTLLKIYPNPTTGSISVDWNTPTRQTVELQLINAEGKVIQQLTRQATGVLQTEMLWLGGQPAGTYFLRLVTPRNRTIIRKILKH